MSEENLLLRTDHTIWPLHAGREKHVSLLSQSVLPDENIHRSSRNIASIDFGSQRCISIAWATAGTQDIAWLKLNEIHSIVPTAILLKEGDPVKNENGVTIGITCRPESFGYDAQHNYPKLRNRDKQNYIYFKRMKMRLEHDRGKDVNRGMKIYSYHREGKNGEWYLIEVIAFIICYLKNKLMSYLSMAGHRISKATELDWVITVPTIWQTRGKQMMREAGYLAGLCGGDEIKYLSYPTSNVQQKSSEEIISSKLSLVPKSEATALYCQQLKPENIAKYCKNQPETYNNPQRYIVIDIGNFTVDIAAHEVISETGEAKIILAVRNNDCGGMSVNREFARFFQKVVGEDETEVVYELESAFPKLLQHNPALKSILNQFINKEFEVQKEMFGLKSKDENPVKIPHKLYSLDEVKSRVAKFFAPAEADVEDDVIYLKSSKMNNFFQPAIQGILHCIQKALADIQKKGFLPTVIYLVGEFGGCKYVYQCIDEFLATIYSDIEYSLIVPEYYKLAAVNGGILYKKKPAITSQCLNLTSPDHHNLNHNEDGNQICDDDAFLSFLKKDDQVSVEDIVVEEILPDTCINKEKVVSIQYGTTHTDKRQVDDPISRSIHKKSLKNKMEIMKGDVVFFELESSVSSLFAFVRGKVQYIGPVPSESEGIYFGIEIIDDRYRGKGTTDGRPHFTCGANNGVYVSIDEIVMKIEQDIPAIAKGKRNNSNVQQPSFVQQPTITNSQGNGPYNNGPPAIINRNHKEASLKEIATNQAVTVPDYKRQNEIIRPLLSQKFVIGDKWYLVDSMWLVQWKMYTGYNDWYMYHYSAGEENANPGPIDNANLFKNHTSDELKKDLMEYVDYSVISKPAYDLLVSWYGLSRGSRHICRCVVEFGNFVKKVEVYLCDLKLCIHPNINHIKLIPFSRADTVRKVYSKIIEIFEIPSGAETRVWKRSMNDTYVLSNVDQTLSDAGINEGQLIMLEIKNKHGQWPCGDPLKNEMKIMKGDVVLFKLLLSMSSLFAFVRGKVQYIGHVPSESEGIYGIEIIDDLYRGKGTTDGRPHFTCGTNNGVYVSIDEIVMKIEQDIPAIAKGKRNNSNVQQPSFVRQPTITNSQGNGPYNNGPPAIINRNHKEASLKEIATNQAVTVPDYKRQKEIIQPLLSRQFVIGDKWYLVDSVWFNNWKIYTNTGYNDDDDDWYMYQYSEILNPGPIDNAKLLKNQTSDELKKDLMEYVYYSMIPKPAYDLLVSWYGLSRGSRHICRCVVEFGNFVKKVEVYLCDLKLCIHPNIKNIKLIPFSRADTVRKVHSKIIETFEVPSGAETRVWKRSMNGKYVLSNVDQTLSDAGINEGQLIMLEIKNKHGQWPCGDLVITSKQKRIMPPDNTSSSSTVPAKLIENNEHKQTTEQGELKTREVQRVVFESSIIRISNFFGRLKTEFLALEDFGATLRSFSDDKKTSITLDYAMTICTSVSHRTTEHNNAGWPITIRMERCFILNNSRNNPVYFIAETPELAKKWIEKLDEARKKHSTMSLMEATVQKETEQKIAREFGPSVEEYRAQKELLDQANKEKDQLMSAVNSLEAENKETIAKYEEQINKLTCDKEELVREKRQLETNLMSKEKEMTTLTEKERESTELAKYFESEKTTLKEKKVSLEMKNATLTREKANLEGEKRKLEQEKETLEKDRSNLIFEKAVMKREKATLQNTLRDVQEKYHYLETENRLLRDVRLELQEKNKQFQAEQKKNQILQGENKQLQGEKQQLQDENQQLQDEKQQLQGEKQQHQGEKQQLQDENQQLQDEKQQLQGEKQQLQDENQQLQDEKQQLQAEQRVLWAKVSANEQSWKINHKDVKMTKQELGRGGWGVIWIGQFRGQKVAVKQLHETIVAEHYLQLLHREINTMSQLRHPNLLQFIGAVLDDPSGNPMIVTEIMDVSLRGAYEKKQLSPLPVHIPLAIMRDVAVGLNYLHCLPDPIIHRDVSSANVLLESKGPGKWKTKISDFGSAKFARSAVTKAAGSIVYCAPEAFQSMSILDSEDDQILTPKMDVFSYGVLLCEVLTCRFPDQQVFREMLEQVRSQHHSYVHDLIHSCIKRNPQDRPDMDQVIQQLDEK